jgi:hypothetical protein
VTLLLVLFAVFGFACYRLGYARAMRVAERPRRWIDLRLVKRTGDPTSNLYVETRDLMDGIKTPAFRKLLEQANQAKEAEVAYRYEVRVHEQGEVVESRRFLRGDKAEEFHNAAAAKVLTQGAAAEKWE